MHEIKRTIKELLRQSISEGMGRGKQQELRPKTRTSPLEGLWSLCHQRAAVLFPFGLRLAGDPFLVVMLKV